MSRVEQGDKVVMRVAAAYHIRSIFGFHLFVPMLSASSVLVGNQGLISDLTLERPSTR